MHIEELHELYSTPNAIHVIKSSRMRQAGHVMGMEGKINEQMPLLGNLKLKDYLVDPSLDWRMILTNQKEI